MHRLISPKIVLGLLALIVFGAPNVNSQTLESIRFDSMASLSDMCFINSKIGYLTSTSTKPGLYKTKDAGKTWTGISIDSTKDFVSGLFGVHFVDENVGYACGESNTLVKTEDGGQTWRTLNTKMPFAHHTRLQEIYFKDSLEGFIVTQSGRVIKTQDGGRNWTSVFDGSGTIEWYDVSFYNDSIGVVAGRRTAGVFKSLVIKTTDGGQTWDTAFYKENTYLTGFTSNERHLTAIVRDHGSIENQTLFSDDLGDNWKLEKSNTLKGWVPSIITANNGNTIALSADSGVLVSKDTFATWKTSKVQKGQNLNRIHAYNDTTFFCYGYQGTLIKYTLGRSGPIVTHASKPSVDLKVSVYPNPGMGFIHFTQPVEQVKVYNTKGTLVTEVSNTDLLQMDISSLENGIYILHVVDENRESRTIRYFKN